MGDKKSLSALSNASNVSQNATTPISGSAIVYDSSVSTLGDRLTLNWVLPNNSDIIHFQLVCKCTGWVALGLGAGMGPATDMMVGRVSTSGQVIINDYWSEEEETPDEDEEEGGTNDLILLSGSQINGITTISFSRKLVSMDKYDQNISIGWNEIVLAFQPDSFELKDHHENMAIGKILVVRGGPGKGLVAGGYTFSRSTLSRCDIFYWRGDFSDFILIIIRFSHSRIDYDSLLARNLRSRRFDWPIRSLLAQRKSTVVQIPSKCPNRSHHCCQRWFISPVFQRTDSLCRTSSVPDYYLRKPTSDPSFSRVYDRLIFLAFLCSVFITII